MNLSLKRRAVLVQSVMYGGRVSGCGLAVGVALLMTGCAPGFFQNVATDTDGAGFHGTIYGGQQPVSNAKVYLYAAGVGGYGTAARSMLGGSGYVTTGSLGQFSITSDYTCQAGDQVYLLATGGNPGLVTGTNNTGIGLMAALGACNLLSASTTVVVNEVTTVAAAYALAGFMATTTTLSSSGTTLARTGVANAFLNAANIVGVNGGGSYLTTPAGNGTVPQAEIDTLGNILASCVNSNGSTCAALFAAATPPGGTVPTDTAQAALNIAHDPGVNVSTLFGLGATSAPFQPTLQTAPNDWTIAVSYTGGGLDEPGGVNFDGLGNGWVANFSSDAISEFNTVGVPVVSNGYTGGGLAGQLAYSVTIDTSNRAWATVENPTTYQNYIVVLNQNGSQANASPGYTDPNLGDDLDFDSAGNVWSCNYTQTSSGGEIYFAGEMLEFNATGNVISKSGGDPGGGLGICFFESGDANGNMWVGNLDYPSGFPGAQEGVVSKFSSSGVAQSPAAGWTAPGLNTTLPTDIAFDHSGNAWVPYEGTSIAEFNSAGALVSGSGFPTGLTDGLYAAAVDGTGRIWVSSDTAIGVLSSAGVALSPAGGYQSSVAGGTIGIRIDGSGNVWSANAVPQGSSTVYSVVEFVGVASPVVTPMAAEKAANLFGTRP